MDPILGAALIGGGTQLIGGLMGNRSSAKQAEKQMKFQERMSSTAHQRQVKDLKKAGLNPLLGIGGTGASTPSGAMADQKNIAEGLASTALEVSNQRLAKAKQTQEVNNMKTQQSNMEAQNANLKTQNDLNKAMTAKALMDAKVSSKTLPQADAVNKIYNKASPILNTVLEGIGTSAKNPQAGVKVKPMDRKQYEKERKQWHKEKLNQNKVKIFGRPLW